MRASGLVEFAEPHGCVSRFPDVWATSGPQPLSVSAYDDLERLEHDVPAKLRGDLELTSLLIAIALDELPD